jgi:hypothetical protein
MTQSGKAKAPKRISVPKVVITEETLPDIKDPEPVAERPTDRYSLLIEQLREERPVAYDQFIKLTKAQKRVTILSDLSLRIG